MGVLAVQLSIVAGLQALPLRRQVGDLFGEAVTLAWLGYLSAGEKKFTAGLDHYARALDLLRKIGDCWTERQFCQNVANIHRAMNNLAAVEEQLRQVVALDEALNHPDLESDREALEEVQAARRAQASGS